MRRADRDGGLCRPCRLLDRIEIDRSINDIGKRVQTLVDRRYLSHLDQPEMPLGQRDTVLAQDRTEDPDLDPVKRRRHQRKMTLARDAVQNHAGDIDVVPISGTTECDGRRGLGLTGDIEHEHHWPAKQSRQIGC